MSNSIRAACAIAAMLALSACATLPSASHHPEAMDAYTTTLASDPAGELDAALANAAQDGKSVLIVMGANWCHDSRALAGWLETLRFADLVEERYHLVFVNVGRPQSGDTHNLALAARFGIDTLESTPALLVIGPDGRLRNRGTAKSWRNAASRSEDAIFDELAALAVQPAE